MSMTPTQKTEILAEFRGHLEAVLAGTHIRADDVLEEFSSEAHIPSAVVADLIRREGPALRTVFEEILHTEIHRLAVLPASAYVLDNLKVFQAAFPALTLYDNRKRGLCIHGVEILDPEELALGRVEVDGYLLASGQASVQRIFLPRVVPERTVTYQQLSRRLLQRQIRMTDGPDAILERIRKAGRPLVLLVGLYYPNVYTPMLKSLEEQGYDVFLLCRQPLAAHAGYAASVDRVVPFAEKHLVDFHEMLHVVRYLDRGMLWLIAETLYDCAWNGARSVQAYAFPAALLRLCRVPAVLNLYDVIRPLRLSEEVEPDAVLTYTRMLASASGVILNANTSETARFLENTLGLKRPITSFFRYNHAAGSLLPQRTDGFHIVVVGIFLGEHGDPVRVNMQEHIASLLRQGLHVHYYSDHPAVHAFAEGLDPPECRFFHRHPSILDQQQLMREISQYHAGWMIHRTQAFVDLMASLRSPFLKDLIYLFHQTTIPSCALLFGNAGLPMFVNRSMQGLPWTFPPEYYLQVELSEIAHLRSFIDRTDWQAIRRKTLARRRLFCIEDNIQALLPFLEGVVAAHRAGG